MSEKEWENLRLPSPDETIFRPNLQLPDLADPLTTSLHSSATCLPVLHPTLPHLRPSPQVDSFKSIHQCVGGVDVALGSSMTNNQSLSGTSVSSSIRPPATLTDSVHQPLADFGSSAVQEDGGLGVGRLSSAAVTDVLCAGDVYVPRQCHNECYPGLGGDTICIHLQL